jgi:hypothetical protein
MFSFRTTKKNVCNECPLANVAKQRMPFGRISSRNAARMSLHKVREGKRMEGYLKMRGSKASRSFEMTWILCASG